MLRPGLRRHRRRRRAGVDRGRPPAGRRHREDHGRGQGAVVAGRPAERRSSRSRPPSTGCPRSPHALAEGISVNVTLIFAWSATARSSTPSSRPRAGAGQRPRPVQDRLGGVVLRLPRRHRDRQAARRDRHPEAAALRARRRSPTRGSRTSVRGGRSPSTALGGAAKAGARPSARCGPRPASRTPTTRHPVRRPSSSPPDTVNTMPEKTLEAVADHGEITGDTIRPHYEQAQAGLDELAGARRRLRRRDPGARGRGRREVRRLVARTARQRPSREAG